MESIPTTFKCAYDGPIHRVYVRDYYGYSITLEFASGYWDITVLRPSLEDFIIIYSVVDVLPLIELIYNTINHEKGKIPFN